MKEKKKNLSEHASSAIPNGKNMTIGVVVSEWNEEITSSLLSACIETLKANGVVKEKLHIIHVPGTYELTSGANLLFNTVNCDGVVCLGCVVKGDTRHDEYINQAVAIGLTNLALKVNKAVIFGVLTTENMQQAVDRAGGKHGNKGTEAAVSVLKMVQTHQKLEKRNNTIGF